MKIIYKKSDCLLEQKKHLLNPNDVIPENYNIKYELVDDLSKISASELNTYIPNFMDYLWNKPKIVCQLLLSASYKEMKDHLSNLFCNNFYENILSPNYIENNLLYLITLLLKEEINIINKKADEPIKCLEYFLNSSSCSAILEQFQKKKDVQIFFKTILLNIIENLELSFGNKEMTFNINKIEEDIMTKSRSRKSSCDIIKAGFDLNYTLTNFSENKFYNKNIISMNSDYFQKLILNNKSNTKLVEYLLYHMSESDKKKNMYIPELFLKKNIDDSVYQETLNEYTKNFDKIKNIIDELFKNLLNNLYLLPYSIKCICKIIFGLIKKQYQRLNSFHYYAFISKFFFEKLFNPIFQNPSFGALINTFIISTTTLKNLELISKIITKFVSGNLFRNNKDEEFFIPFNLYFISKISDLFKFFDEINKVELPSFIEKLINDELPENFEYNYFLENPEEVVYHRSICFTFEDLYLLIDLMEKNKKKIFPKNADNDMINKLEKTLEKLSNKKNKEAIRKLKNNPDYEIIKVPVYDKKKKKLLGIKEEKGRQIIKYYLVSDLSLNKKYSDIFNINQDIKYFNLPELKDMKTDEENQQNNIIKVKNFFCTILYNYRMLVKTDFEEGKIENTISILKELKKFMKSSNNIIDGAFPSQWYVNSLLDYLNKIPPNLVKDDCEFLINELQKDVNNAIKNLNFEDLSVLIDKMKFSDRGKIYYEKTQNLIIDIYLNKKAQAIVEKEIIEVEILLKYNDKNKEFSITPPNKDEKHLCYLDNIFEEPKKKPSRLCKTIKLFTKNFPDFIKYQNFYKINAFQIERELKVPQKINNYFKIIKDHIKNNLNITNEKEFLSINNKINDYIMEKLYEKLYPRNLDDMDTKINENCKKLGWVEPKHFIKGKKNYIYESFLPDLTNYLMLMTKQKSIRKKFIYANLIFQCMDSLGKFNGEGQFSLDDKVNILNYVFIKSKPYNIYTNCEYMELFIGNNSVGIDGQNLAQLKIICEHVANLSAAELNVKEKEYEENCKKFRLSSVNFDLDIVI